MSRLNHRMRFIEIIALNHSRKIYPINLNPKVNVEKAIFSIIKRDCLNQIILGVYLYEGICIKDFKQELKNKIEPKEVGAKK